MTELGQIWVVSIPLRTPFRSIKTREALIFKTERWSEWSPFIEYEDPEAARWLAAAIAFGKDPLPQLHRTQIGVNATLPAVAPSEIARALGPFGNFNTVKIKVAAPGENLAIDLERVIAVHEQYPNAKLRLDANGGYSVSEALDLAEKLVGLPIEYLEQPVATVEQMATLKKELSGTIKIAADESIRKASDPFLVRDLDAADIVMLKSQPLGGIQRSLDIARETGLEVVVSSALETSIGISQGAYLAAALPNLKYDCGLNTVNLLTGDITTAPLVASDSVLDVREVEADLALLEKFSAAPERQEFWRARLERSLKLL